MGGTPVEDWNDIPARLEEAKGAAVPFQIQRGSDRLEMAVTAVRQTKEIQAIPPKVTQVTPGSPAEQAGIQAGDKVIAYDGTPIASSEDLQRLVRVGVGRKAHAAVERKGQRLELEVTPRLERDQATSKMVGRIGVTLEMDMAQEPVRLTRDEWILGASQLSEPIPLHRALVLGAKQTWFFSVLTLRVLGRLVMGDISPKAIGGPIYIAAEAGRQAKQGGVLQLMGLTAVLSVNLAILNLLPIPILDGGHLLFFAIEKVRGGPLSLRKREIAQQVGLALLVALMVFAFYNDIFRLLGRH
jgi:regulator of sigma E protease